MEVEVSKYSANDVAYTAAQKEVSLLSSGGCGRVMGANCAGAEG